MIKVVKNGIIKLYPSKGKIKPLSIVQYGNDILTVLNIDDCFINKTIPIHKVKLLKYYITNNSGIIGELDYNDYNTVAEGVNVKVKCKTILNKMEIGDDVRIFKINIKLFSRIKSNSITGTILAINGRTATVDIHGSTEQIKVKRHMLKLLKCNNRIICKII